MFFHNTYFDCKKNLTRSLIFIVLFFSSFYLFAGAAEDIWKYEPELKNMNIQVTGHKVDQFGNAANDAKYVRTIDPKVGAARTAQGTVGMGRLLKTSGWGLLGTVALEKLLEGVGWVIDPATQSIWRNKPDEGGGPSYSCKNFGFTWKNQLGNPFTCPEAAANNYIQTKCTGSLSNCTLLKMTSDSGFQNDISNLPNDASISTIYVRYSALWGGSLNYFSTYIDANQKINVPQPVKEYLTPDGLSDYVNRTHPDYKDPKLAPKLEPNWNPQLAPDLWTPANPFEETNSPTVQIAKKELDNANPTSPDPEVKPNPDTGGMTLPNFCDWAFVVCDFFKDINKEQPQENDKDLEIDDSSPEVDKVNVSIGDDNCPSYPYTFDAGFFSYSGEISPTYICQMATGIKTFVIALGFFLASMIVGNRGAT